LTKFVNLKPIYRKWAAKKAVAMKPARYGGKKPADQCAGKGSGAVAPNPLDNTRTRTTPMTVREVDTGTLNNVGI
jgi:hypothetical protein